MKVVESATKKKLPIFCKNDLSPENAKKLRNLFKDEKTDDMILYFNAKNGMKVLVDSLEFN